MARRSFQPRTPEREKEWVNIPGSTLQLTANGTSVFASGLNLAASSTLVRCRGEMIINRDTGTIVAGDECRIALGLGIVSTDAFAAGAGSLPDPEDQPEYPWLWWQSIPFFFQNATAGEFLGPEGSVRRVIDTKAMRKVKSGQSLVMIAQYVDVTGAPPMNLSMGQVRVLAYE